MGDQSQTVETILQQLVAGAGLLTRTTLKSQMPYVLINMELVQKKQEDTIYLYCAFPPIFVPSVDSALYTVLCRSSCTVLFIFLYINIIYSSLERRHISIHTPQ